MPYILYYEPAFIQPHAFVPRVWINKLLNDGALQQSAG